MTADEKEVASGAYLPTLEEIWSHAKKIREENDAKERAEEKRTMREFLLDEEYEDSLGLDEWLAKRGMN